MNNNITMLKKLSSQTNNHISIMLEELSSQTNNHISEEVRRILDESLYKDILSDMISIDEASGLSFDPNIKPKENDKSNEVWK